MIELNSRDQIKRFLPQLKTSSADSPGTWLIVYYYGFAKKSPRQYEESQVAKNHCLDLHIYTGPLVSVVPSTKKDGSFVFTILCLTRVLNDEYCYRTFNINKGEVTKLIAFPELASATRQVHAVEIPLSWLQRIWKSLKSLKEHVYDFK